MEQTKVSWLLTRNVLSSTAWRGILLTLLPPVVFGALGRAVSEKSDDTLLSILLIVVAILWLPYFYWAWLVSLRTALQKHKVQFAGELPLQPSEATEQPTKV